MKKIVITGGAGFIASHVTDYFCKAFPFAEVIVIDRISYAARREHLMQGISSGQVRLIEATINNRSLMSLHLRDTDLVIHAAAESHVDNSYRDIAPFVRNNIEGTISLLQAAVDASVGMFLNVSTDEVYGDCREMNATSSTPLNPTNPYSASKAAAEMFVKCFAQSYGLRVRTTRANNIYGTRQFPEKLIPKLICDALLGRTFQLHGAGTVKRSFLHVEDYCRALIAILERGADNEAYNIVAPREYAVIEVVEMVAKALGVPSSSFVQRGPDRPHNDSRYGLRGEKMRGLGWRPERSLPDDLDAIIGWYRDNLHLYQDAMTIAEPRDAFAAVPLAAKRAAPAGASVSGRQVHINR